jgi:NAD(P)-dependent dehydrogenase (short-subunit alcohol dehydrogenase family)
MQNRQGSAKGNNVKHVKGTNIKVNSVHPGWVKTALGSAAAPTSVPDGSKDHSGGRTAGIG